nr:hypothetical protein [Bacillus mycoides]
MLKDGIVQQVGTPKEVYDNPVIIDKWKIEVPEEKMKSLRNNGYTNKEIIIGIRLEDFYYGKAIEALPYNAKVTVPIDVAELMGDRNIFIF